MSVESPVFVCECCGKIVRALAYEESDVYHCPFCRTVMTKTEYSLYESEYSDFFGNNRESDEFANSVFQEYVRYSPRFNLDKLSERLLEDIRVVQEYMKMMDGVIR